MVVCISQPTSNSMLASDAEPKYHVPHFSALDRSLLVLLVVVFLFHKMVER